MAGLKLPPMARWEFHFGTGCRVKIRIAVSNSGMNATIWLTFAYDKILEYLVLRGLYNFYKIFLVPPRNTNSVLHRPRRKIPGALRSDRNAGVGNKPGIEMMKIGSGPDVKKLA